MDKGTGIILGVLGLIEAALIYIAWNLPGWFEERVAGWGFIIGVVVDIIVLIPIMFVVGMWMLLAWAND